MKEIEAIRAMAQLGYRMDLMERRLEDFHDTATLKFVNQYVERFPVMRERGVGLFISGRPGSGKTLIATLLVKHLLMRWDINALGSITDLDELAEVLLRPVHLQNEVAFKTMTFCTHPILVIDDVPKLMDRTQKTSRPPEDILAYILRERRKQNLVTFVLSGHPPRELAEKIGSGPMRLIDEATLPYELPNYDHINTLRENNMRLLLGGDSN